MYYICNAQDGYVSIKDTTDGVIESYSYDDLIRLSKQVFIGGVVEDSVTVLNDKTAMSWYTGDYIGESDFGLIGIVNSPKRTNLGVCLDCQICGLMPVANRLDVSYSGNNTKIAISELSTTLMRYGYFGNYRLDYVTNNALKKCYSSTDILGRLKNRIKIYCSQDKINFSSGYDSFTNLFSVSEIKDKDVIKAKFVYVQRVWCRKSKSGVSALKLCLGTLSGVYSIYNIEEVYKNIVSNTYSVDGITLSGKRMICEGVDGIWSIDIDTVNTAYGNRMTGANLRLAVTSKLTGNVIEVFDNGYLNKLEVTNGVLEIPNNVKAIGDYAISVKSDINRVVLPASLQKCSSYFLKDYDYTSRGDVFFIIRCKKVSVVHCIMRVVISKNIIFDLDNSDTKVLLEIIILYLNLHRTISYDGYEKLSSIFYNNTGLFDNKYLAYDVFYSVISRVVRRDTNNLSTDKRVELSQRSGFYGYKKSVRKEFCILDTNYRNEFAHLYGVMQLLDKTRDYWDNNSNHYVKELRDLDVSITGYIDNLCNKYDILVVSREDGYNFQ